jgi:hypothetical protein
MALAISLAACIALFRFEMGTIRLIGACSARRAPRVISSLEIHVAELHFKRLDAGRRGFRQGDYSAIPSARTVHFHATPLLLSVIAY